MNMKRYLLSSLLVILSLAGMAQAYNNEWIDYSKTYYKFKVGSNGLFHIPQPALAAAGIGNVPAQHFQLWRNGVEVPIYTSVATGNFSPADFIEFYGEMNDGKIDKALYKYDTLQMSDKWSILTDTAAYYLTINSTTANARLATVPNNVAANVLPAENFFNYKLGKYFKDVQNPGYGIDFGEVVHSSAFDFGEGWASNDIYVAPYGPGNLIDANNNLFVYPSGPAATITAVAAGNYTAYRNLSLKINNTTISTKGINGYEISKFNNIPVPLATFSGDAANVEFIQDGSGVDHVVISHYEISYPRQYNFGGQTRFNFELPASGSKFIAVKNFGFGVQPPVLIDLTNNLRFTGVITADTVKFVLPASVTVRKLVLLNTETTNITNINTLTPRNFINYGQPGNQGDYLIISHSSLFNNGSGIDNVEKYRQYRASAPGGGFNAKTIDIDQLTDQFAFGVKHHPLAIRNFASYSLANFTAPPKYFFLIGKGLNYMAYHSNEADPNVNGLALVPSFGWPPSDNLLTATRTGNSARIAIGRLSAISGNEIGDFLDKMKQFELAQTSNPQTVSGKGWMKNMAQITGAIDDQSLFYLISSYMDGYQQILSDTSFGAKVYNFSKNSGQYTAIGSTKTIDSLFSEGVSMINYFGHSSPNTLEFNLDNPQNYSNTGKYPLIIVNGCNSGNLFLFDTLRPISKGTLSEKYIFTPQKGSIGFIADTHFGLPQQLNYFNTIFADNIAGSMYGRSLGDIMKSSMETLTTDYSFDFLARCHAEEITFHGDPATKLNPHALPDYTLTDSLITFNPGVISVADEKITITSKILNIGKSTNDSISIRIQHQLPNNAIVTLETRRIKATIYEDTIQTTININPLLHKGLNRIIVTIDPANLLPELSESNNSITKEFTILEDEIRPVYPFNYAIVNSSSNFAVYGSTADPLASAKQYIMEMDTSRFYNSPSKITKTVTNSGGIIKFSPGITLVDSTTYYWRLTTGPVNAGSRWLSSSFVYINGSYEGYNQSHYYQYTDNSFNTMNIESASRKFNFNDKTRKLLIRTGLYPYYDWDQINVNVDNDQINAYGCKYNSLQFVVYDPLTMKPWVNYNTSGSGRFQSWPVCDAATRNIFEFPYNDSVYRRRAMQFLDSIPQGYYVSVTNLGWIYNNVFVNQWKADTVNLGSGKSLWHKFHAAGLHAIDGFTANLPFLFVFKKGDTLSFTPRQQIGPTANTQIVDTFNITGKNILGSVTTPWLGPSKSWKRFKWNLKPDNNPNTQKSFDIMGQDNNGDETLISTVTNLQDTSILGINASVFPYLKLRINNTDPVEAKAAQLKFWLVTADEYPEGAVSPNTAFQCQDTLNSSDTLKFKVTFKNISKIAFDSIKVNLTITNTAGVNTVFNNQANGARLKPLVAGDSVIIQYNIPALGLGGNNQLKLDVNPGNDQVEQYHFNNLLYKNFYVISPVCPGGSTTFNCGNSTSGNTYQWQLNSGAGYSNISNGGVYAGTNSGILAINAAPTSMYGNKYRCAITNNGQTSYSNEFILKFGVTWNGTVNTAWETPGNWDCGILPDNKTDVIIRSGVPNNPRVNSNVTCRSISAKTGSNITITTGFGLIITGASN